MACTVEPIFSFFESVCLHRFDMVDAPSSTRLAGTQIELRVYMESGSVHHRTADSLPLAFKSFAGKLSPISSYGRWATYEPSGPLQPHFQTHRSLISKPIAATPAREAADPTQHRAPRSKRGQVEKLPKITSRAARFETPA